MYDRTGPRHDLAAAAAASGSQSNKIKLTVAIVGLVLAGALLAYNFGVFSPKGKPPVERTAAEQKKIDTEFQEQEILRQEMENDPTVEVGGA